ncbi:MAG: alpha/beta fold hydrolase [Gammaproteobacteria bacterium]
MEGIFHLGDFTLQSGVVLREAFVGYETHGTLNADRSNVILYPTWYGGTHVANRGAIADGRTLDPSRYFIVVTDQFGNGLSSSPSNTPRPHDRMRFPLVTPYDNVAASHRLLTEEFGIERIALVVGYSMSAQQAFHWAAVHPDMVERIAPICGSAKTTPHDWLHLEAWRLALTADAAWANGDYDAPPEKGMRAFIASVAAWFASQTYYREGKHLTFGGNRFDSMQAYLDGLAEAFGAMDANDYLAMLATWQSADVGNHPDFDGSLEAALGSISCPAMVLPAESDLYFPPADSALAVSLMPNAELRVIPGISGHLAGFPGIASADEEAFIDRALRDLLAL